MLSNAQNLQQNMAQSLNGAFLNGMTQNGANAHATIQGRSFLNGVPNRKRSFEGMEVNPLKKARPNGLSMPPELLNGNGPLGGPGEAQMESMSTEMVQAVTSVTGERHCVDFSSSNQTAGMLLGQHIYTELSSSVGSQVEHQKSVKAEQLYDHTLYSTMLLYHGC